MEGNAKLSLFPIKTKQIEGCPWFQVSPLGHCLSLPENPPACALSPDLFFPFTAATFFADLTGFLKYRRICHKAHNVTCAKQVPYTPAHVYKQTGAPLVARHRHRACAIDCGQCAGPCNNNRLECHIVRVRVSSRARFCVEVVHSTSS